MRKIIALFLTLCLAGSMISCNRVPTDGKDSTEETEYETDSGEDLNYVACTESEAAPFLQSYLYISNEGLDSYKYPDVEVYYAGEWMFDSEGLPVVIEQ